MLWQQLVVAVLVGLFVVSMGPVKSVAAVLAVLAVLLALFASPKLVVAGFLAFMLITHQYRSFFVLPFGGIVWHPRELLLFAALAYWAAKVLQGKVRIPADPLHFAFVLYGLFFVQIAVVGLYYEPNLQQIITECRYPIFLLSYVLLISFVRDRRDLRFHMGVVFSITTLIAAASIALFTLTFLTGNIISTQNAFGEFVQRQVGPLLFTSVRPNGHMFFEISVVVLVSLVVCSEISKKLRLLYLALIGFLCAAILITMMRTAYVALIVSLGMLAFLCIPNRRTQALVAAIGLAGGVAVLPIFGAAIHALVEEAVAGVGASIKGRLVEIAGAWHTFKEHPVLGTGMGSGFKGFGYVSKTSQLAYAQTTYHTVHNVWMYYLFKGGLAGFLLAAVALGAMFARGYYLVPIIRDPKERALLRGFVAALGGQLVASIAMPRLTYPEGHVFLAMMGAAFVVLARQNAVGHNGPDGPRAAQPQ